MKTFIVVSDSHGRRGCMEKIAPLIAENSGFIHLGDGVSDARRVESDPENTYLLRGNCDFSYAQEECVIREEGVSVFCCHGHRYGVKSGLERLTARAKELGCEVALYGHTHRACVEEREGVLLVNPGSLGDYAEPSYCYLVLHRGKATATVVPLY